MIIRGLVHLISRVLGCQIHQVAHHRKMLLNAISTDGTWAKTNFLNCTYISHAPISTHEQGANAHFLKARRYCTELFCAIRGYCTENLEQLATTRVLCNKLSHNPVWQLIAQNLLSTDIARQRDSLQMVCFNVVSYAHALPLFSTYFANLSSSWSIWETVLACFHHWFHLFVKFLQVSWYKTWNCYSSFIIWPLFV